MSKESGNSSSGVQLMINKYSYRDKKTSRGYWIEDDQFMSAPLLEVSDDSYGEIDYDNAENINGWNNMEPFEEDSSKFQHLILILEKLLERH
jgi:hypothetical protein